MKKKALSIYFIVAIAFAVTVFLAGGIRGIGMSGHKLEAEFLPNRETVTIWLTTTHTVTAPAITQTTTQTVTVTETLPPTTSISVIYQTLTRTVTPTQTVTLPNITETVTATVTETVYPQTVTATVTVTEQGQTITSYVTTTNWKTETGIATITTTVGNGDSNGFSPLFVIIGIAGCVIGVIAIVVGIVISNRR